MVEAERLMALRSHGTREVLDIARLEFACNVGLHAGEADSMVAAVHGVHLADGPIRSANRTLVFAAFKLDLALQAFVLQQFERRFFLRSPLLSLLSFQFIL